MLYIVKLCYTIHSEEKIWKYIKYEKLNAFEINCFKSVFESFNQRSGNHIM
jgi:hypothetical protein